MNKYFAFSKSWIENSGIQKGKSGFYSWYDTVKQDYGYLYSEITGYGITSLTFLNVLNPDPILIAKAKKAADWLISDAMEPFGGFKTRKYSKKGEDAYSFERKWIYAFDCGMILAGLMNLWKATKESIYLEAAKKSGDFLVEKMWEKNKGFFAYYVPEEDGLCDKPIKWSDQTGSYHTKLSMGLIKLSDAAQDEKYAKTAEKCCEESLSLFENGRFITNRKDMSTHLHPHCYSIEGLIYAGSKLGRGDFIKAAANALKWAINLQKKDGGIPFMVYNNNNASEYERTDVLSQVLRAGSLLSSMGLINGYEDKLRKLENRLIQFQHLESGKQNGGFYFGYDFDGKFFKHLNSWCSMFAMQALSFRHYDNALSNEEKISYLV